MTMAVLLQHRARVRQIRRELIDNRVSILKRKLRLMHRILVLALARLGSWRRVTRPLRSLFPRILHI